MKYLASLAFTTLLALPVAAQRAYPLGHHVYSFQRAASVGTVTSQGWDPTYDAGDQADKERMVAGIPTFTVGLPGGREPGDLGNTGCPANLTISSSSDVAGLPTVSLAGVSGPVYLISDCNRQNDILRVQNGMNVAVWSSAFQQVVGVSAGSGQVWVVDSLIDAAPNDNAGLSCLGDTPCRVMYSEVLGGDDIMKMNPGDVCFKSHLHGYDRDSTAGSATTGGEHNDGIQINPGSFFTVINCNVEGPFRNSNAPLFAGVAGDIHHWRVADTLSSGGTNAYKLGSKTTTNWLNAVLLNSQLLGDASGVSWGTDSMGASTPCSLGGAGGEFSGEGNTASNGATSGVDQRGRSWDFGDCNVRPVSQANKDFFTSTTQQLETWTAQIRAAAGAPTAGASITVVASPNPLFTSTPFTLTGTATGCSPAQYQFECGDDTAFDDGTSITTSIECAAMAPGSYTASVRASGGTCSEPLVGQTPLTISRPPAPELL